MKYIVELPNGYDAKLAAEACGAAADIIGRTQDEWVGTLCDLSRALHNARPVTPPKTSGGRR